MFHLNVIFVFLNLVLIHGFTLNNNTKNDLIHIGDKYYVKQKIPQLDGLSTSKYMSENSVGDIYLWDGFMPKVLKKGWDEPQTVEGVKSKVIKGLVVDSKDNLFFVRTFEGLFVLQPGREELDLRIHVDCISVHIDINDNIYVGNYNGLFKIQLFYDASGFIDYAQYEYINEMDGVIIPAGILPNGDIYYRKNFLYFFYRNLNEGKKSEKRIEDIDREAALCASVDLDGNSYVATTDGLLFLTKNQQGQIVQHIGDLGTNQVNSVWVNWRTGDILVALGGEAIYRLTPL